MAAQKQSRRNSNGNGRGTPSPQLPDKHEKKRKLNPGFEAKIWKPGQSGNPKGRPKYKTLSESLRHFLEQPIGRGKNATTTAEAIAIEILKKARGGRTKADVRAFEAVRDTVEGKPPQRVLLEGDSNQRERERQVKFLSRTIKTVASDGASIEETWRYIEAKEKSLFDEDISHLKPLVMAALEEEN